MQRTLSTSNTWPGNAHAASFDRTQNRLRRRTERTVIEKNEIWIQEKVIFQRLHVLSINCPLLSRGQLFMFNNSPPKDS